MRVGFAVVAPSMLAGLSVASAAALAQKTVKACQDEWRANRAAGQAAGATENQPTAKSR